MAPTILGLRSPPSIAHDDADVDFFLFCLLAGVRATVVVVVAAAVAVVVAYHPSIPISCALQSDILSPEGFR